MPWCADTRKQWDSDLARTKRDIFTGPRADAFFERRIGLPSRPAEVPTGPGDAPPSSRPAEAPKGPGDAQPSSRPGTRPSSTSSSRSSSTSSSTSSSASGTAGGAASSQSQPCTSAVLAGAVQRGVLAAAAPRFDVPEAVAWVWPTSRGAKLHVRIDMIDSMCKACNPQDAFKAAACRQTGQTSQAAAATGASWCKACARIFFRPEQRALSP